MTNDLSSQARADEQQTALLRFSKLIENLQAAILVENEQGRVVLVNKPFCAMFGISPSQDTFIDMDSSAINEQCKRLFADSQGFARRMDEILRERVLVNGEELLLRDGRVFERDYIPIWVGQHYLGHLWQYRDATDAYRLRQRQQRLLDLEHLQRTIINLFLQSDDVDSALNQALGLVGSFLDISRAYVFHFRRNERVLDNTHEWCAPGVIPEKDNLQGLLIDELMPSFFPLLARDSLIAPRHIDELPMDVRALFERQETKAALILPFYSDGLIEGFIGFDETRQAREWLPEEITTIRAVTESYARVLERQRIQAALVEARDAAVRSARLKSEFMSNMSHEIRTPMTGVMGMLELLRETALDEIQREFVDTAHDSARKLLDIINDILDFAKIEAGRVVLQAETIDLAGIVDEVKMTLGTLAALKNVRLEAEIDPNVPLRVVGDATRLRQILMNLVSNAVKFTPRGSIQIRVWQVGTAENRTRLHFEVRDTGIGIQAGHIEHIFDSFVQVDGTPTRKYGGTGLGLAICKQLVELMGGEIEVQSAVGQGSTFMFTLTMPVAASAAPGSSVLSDLRVLVVDEDQTARYVLAQQLRVWGADVVELDSPLDLQMVLVSAAQKFEAFDLVLLRCAPDVVEQDTLVANLRRVAGIRVKGFIRVDDENSTFDAASSAFDARILRPVHKMEFYDLVTRLRGTAVTPSENASTRVLLADDNLVNHGLVKSALEPFGFQVDAVEDGEEALAALEGGPYDAILMDMHMPVMDGFEATRRIRESGASYANIPILALTASVLEDEQRQYLDLGVNAIVSKPFSLEFLRTVLEEWTRRKPLS